MASPTNSDFLLRTLRRGAHASRGAANRGPRDRIAHGATVAIPLMALAIERALDAASSERTDRTRLKTFSASVLCTICFTEVVHLLLSRSGAQRRSLSVFNLVLSVLSEDAASRALSIAKAIRGIATVAPCAFDHEARDWPPLGSHEHRAAVSAAKV